MLFASRAHDTLQKVRWGDGHWAALPAGRAILQEEGGVVYMAMSLQNVGTGTAVILGWRVDSGQIINPNATRVEMLEQPQMVRPDPGTFRPQTRDLYSPPHDLSFWQAAIRTRDDPDRARVEAALAGHEMLLIDLLYGDQEGGQRTISRFSITKYPGSDTEWFPAVVNHWYLDRDGPRQLDTDPACAEGSRRGYGARRASFTRAPSTATATTFPSSSPRTCAS